MEPWALVPAEGPPSWPGLAWGLPAVVLGNGRAMANPGNRPWPGSPLQPLPVL